MPAPPDESAPPAEPAAPAAARPRGKGLLQFKVIAPALFVAAALIAAFVHRHQRLSGVPDPGDPFSDVAAGPDVPREENENAYWNYDGAANRLVEADALVRSELDDAVEGGWDAATPNVREWVAKNRPALDAWKAGADKPRFRFDEAMLEMRLPRADFFDRLFDLAQAACLEGARLQSEGNVEDAWNWHRAVIRCSRHCGQYGLLRERIVGAKMHERAAYGIRQWSADPRVTEALLERALEDVQQDDRLTPATESLLREEYRLAMLRLDDPTQAAGGGSVHGLGRVLLYFMNEPEHSRRVVRHVFANWRGELGEPLAARGTVGWKLPRLHEPPPDRPDAPSVAQIREWLDESILAHDVLPSISEADAEILNERVRQGALLVALAAQRAHRRDARFPERAEDLLGGPLEALPIDPFGEAGAVLRYRRDEPGAVVWSVGSDRVDDGGQLPTSDESSADLVTRIDPPGEGG
ncbi:MAG: hypothetical protein WD069_19970 [Planctomycetales bacterium]